MRRLIDRIERATLRKYNFLLNVWFYISLGNNPRQAWHKARDTL